MCVRSPDLYPFLQDSVQGVEGGQMYPVSWTVFLAWACISIEDVLPPLLSLKVPTRFQDLRFSFVIPQPPLENLAPLSPSLVLPGTIIKNPII